MRSAIALLAVVLMSFATGSRAQSLDEIGRRDAAVVEAWKKTPLTVRHALFVAERAGGFGMYTARPSNVFKPGEELLIYAEPIGYGWQETSKGVFQFGIDIGFVVRTAQGEILGGNENFGHFVMTSHARNREFMLNLNLNLTGAPEGDYVLEYQIRDVTGARTGKFELPFRIKA